MQMARIYSDGACSGNPGPGGWGAVLQCDAPPREKEMSGGEPHTTNNRMELMAVISALEALNIACRVEVFTDSRYVCDAFRQNWIDKWQKNNWRAANKNPVKNQDLWQRLLVAMAPHEVVWHWLKGHNDHPKNERADRLAVAAVKRQ
jgi:ribonuclease HI